MRRTLAAALTVLALLLLSGCFKVDMDLKIDSDETVDGTMLLAVDEQMYSMMESSGDDPFETDDLPEGAKVEPYAEDGKKGQKVTFTDVPLAELNKSLEEDAEDGTFSLSHEGDQFVFRATMDAATQAGDMGGGSADGDEFAKDMEKMMASMLKDAEFTISLEFPGEVTDSNGDVDGSTVTWDVDLTKATELRATAADEGGSSGVLDSLTGANDGDGDSGFPVAPVAVGAVAVLALLGGGWYVMRRRSAGASDLD